MKYVYMLTHKRVVEVIDGEKVHDSKLIGFYSRLELAEKTIEKYKHITGFKDYPDDFKIERLRLNENYAFI